MTGTNQATEAGEGQPAFPQASGTISIIAEQVESRLDSVQLEMDALRTELNVLRRRDETLNYYMHRLDEELRLAARLQQDFLPKQLPQVGRVRFHTLFRPAGYVSGDLYDVMRLDERRVGFYIADAVGHGVPAALLTMFVKHALQTKDIGPSGYRLLEPGETMRRLNDSMLEQNLSHATFATALYGMIDVDSLQVTFARAGHPGPIHLPLDGSPRSLEPDGGLLGIFPDEHYENGVVQLSPGDRLLIYTDGVEVAFWDDQDSSARRWQDDLFKSRPYLPAEQMLSRFAAQIDAEVGSLAPKDDLTIILLEVLP